MVIRLSETHPSEPVIRVVLLGVGRSSKPEGICSSKPEFCMGAGKRVDGGRVDEARMAT